MLFYSVLCFIFNNSGLFDDVMYIGIIKFELVDGLLLFVLFVCCFDDVWFGYCILLGCLIAMLRFVAWVTLDVGFVCSCVWVFVVGFALFI